ncbi:MAG: undecaprenyl-phosphate glucose phosphotransferase [bacterium TMED88]|nr:undecaprenyl-phosphate glucose phosphotransferase [Deltaproteobacteria bacterium]OUV31691.1 MAG: undecaprenyl-phosphate glucose phosphotransferase [bacterium TMED88]
MHCGTQSKWTRPNSADEEASLLYRYGEVLRTLLIASDLALVATAWLGAYWIRFFTVLEAPMGVPSLTAYVAALSAILPVGWILLRRQGLYQAKRFGSLLSESLDIVKATLAGVMILLAASFFFKMSDTYSRGVVMAFSLLAPGLLISLRVVVRGLLRKARKRGFNLRYVLVVGGGHLSEEVIRRIHAHPESGIHIRGVLADGPKDRMIMGERVIGGYSDLAQALKPERVDQVILALPHDHWPLLSKILKELEDSTVAVRLAPDLLHVLTLRSSIEELDGLPMIGLRDTPLVGWASVYKRGVDVIGSAGLMLATSPLLVGIAVLIRASGPGGVLYRQRRVGLDGREFKMLKFRTMRIEAEAGGAVWSSADDPRRTGIGTVLRRFSLDELPQLWNVLRGEMSLVGPRPERPIFIQEFRREIPGYMLRHKVKSGMTGWAQVHGWRGDSSLHKRIDHDIYYIQNWSAGLDFRILMMTVISVWKGRNAH